MVCQSNPSTPVIQKGCDLPARKTVLTVVKQSTVEINQLQNASTVFKSPVGFHAKSVFETSLLSLLFCFCSVMKRKAKGTVMTSPNIMTSW